MSKERMEEIQHMIGMFDGDVEITLFGHKINSEYVMGEIKWLYQRVQELEDIIYQDERQAMLEGMYEQKERYRKALVQIINARNHFYPTEYVFGVEGIAREALDERSNR